MSTATVLIVDDNPAFLTAYAEWLRGAYDVRTAGSARAGLERLTPDVDLLVLERRMLGPDGDEIATEVAERGLDCQVVMVTAVEPDFDILELPIDEYLLKPVSEDELRTSVDRVLRLTSFDPSRADRYTLQSKKAALEAAKDAEELADSEAFAELEARLATLGEALDVADPPEHPS